MSKRHWFSAPRARRDGGAVAVPEVGANHGGDGDDGEADGQVEAAKASLGASPRIEKWESFAIALLDQRA